MQFDHLKRIDLRGCKNLISIPSLSLAPNLERLNLWGCENLTSILDCSGCKSLYCLTLNDCSKLRRLPEILSNLKYLEFWNCKSLTELPSSFKHLNKVKELEFRGCHSLISIPDLRGWESLEVLTLRHCLKLKMLPELPNSIEFLSLFDSLIEELPKSFQDLYRLRYLEFDHCTRLKSLPSSVCKWKSLKEISLSNCPKIDELPNDLTTLENLNVIVVKKTAIREVPESIINLSNLRELDISYCERLEVLPKLPSANIFAFNCTSLEKLSCPLFCHDLFPQDSDWNTGICVDLGNCYKLDRNSLDNFLETILQNIKDLAASATSYCNWGFVDPCISICYPGSEIPEWFEYQKDGSFIDVSLPFNYNVLYFAVCVVVAFDDDVVDVNYKCTNKSEDHTLFGKMLSRESFEPFKSQNASYRSNHVIYSVGFHRFPTACDNEFTFQFYLEGRPQPKIEKCGVHLVFGKHLEILDESEDVDEPNLEESDQENEPHPKRLKSNLSSAQSTGRIAELLLGD